MQTTIQGPARAGHQHKPNSRAIDAEYIATTLDGASRNGGRKVNVYAAYLSMLDFIDNDLPFLRTKGELIAHLVVWRKTHGWGKTTDAIGNREFERRANLDTVTVRKGLHRMQEQGIVLVESTIQTTKAGNELNRRRRYTWLVNERVQKVLKSKGVGEKITHPVG